MREAVPRAAALRGQLRYRLGEVGRGARAVQPASGATEGRLRPRPSAGAQASPARRAGSAAALLRPAASAERSCGYAAALRKHRPVAATGLGAIERLVRALQRGRALLLAVRF